jgi:hypothetical protein
MYPNHRRTFLKQSAAAGALASLGDLTFLTSLRPVSAAEANLDKKTLRLDSGIEPIVRLLEETPRDRLLEEVAVRIRKGLSYQELLAALLLAGVKNIKPRPSVGHKFHAVLVVNSAHIASMASPPEHRWLPIFWSLDHYKASAQRDVEEVGDWQMTAVDESAVPSPLEAGRAFDDAMDNWDEGAADAAIAALARSAGAAATYERLFRFGMRDFRSIGHKAIYVANSCRTLQAIGWQHAEPVLRSLAFALLMHEGDSPQKRDAEADRPYRRNVDLARNVRKDWIAGKPDPAATTELLATLRTGSNDDACDAVVELLGRGAAPQSIWDALHLGAGELLMRQPGIASLHAVTTANALRYAYLESANNRTRLLAMLQCAAFLPMFRGEMQSRGKVSELKVDELAPASTNGGAPALDDIFAEIGSDPLAAASSVLAHLQETGDAGQFIDAARVLVFLKGNDAHDYKFSSAVLEDYYHLSPAVRDKYLASGVFNLCNSSQPDNRLVERTRNALNS